MEENYNHELKKPEKKYRTLFIVFFLEGLVWFLFYFKSFKNIFIIFNSLSPEVFILTLLLTNLITWVCLYLFSFRSNNFISKLNQKFRSINEKILAITLLVLLIIFGLYIELILLLPITDYFHTLNASYLKNTTYSFLLCISYFIQALLFIIFFQKKHHNKKIFKDKYYKNIFLIFIILFFTLLYWEILIIQAPILSKIPHWFRPIRKNGINLQTLYFLPLMILVWWGIDTVFSKSVKLYKGLILLFLIGYVSQVIFGFISGEGFESVRKSYAEHPISTTVNYACKQDSVIESIQNYESYHGHDFWVQTKPPGFLSGHIIFAKITKLLTNSDTRETCVKNYTRLGTYVFPLLSLFVLFPLTYISKNVFNLKYPLLPGLIYILTPNFMIWVMVADQVIFPLLFMLGFSLIYVTISKQNFILSIVLGIYAYLSIFISFSLIPIFGVFGIWIILKCLTSKNKELTNFLKIILGFTLGFGLSYLIFYATLNYDVISRYQLAFSHHRRIKHYSFGYRSIVIAFILNTIEYFTWTGVPLFFLFGNHIIKSIKKLLNRKPNQKYLFSISVFGLYIVLNLFSQTQGEVQRLWLFLSPIAALVSSFEIEERFKNKRKIYVFVILALQVFTALLHFHFITNQWPKK